MNLIRSSKKWLHFFRSTFAKIASCRLYHSFGEKGEVAEESFLTLSSQSYQDFELLAVCDAELFGESAIKASCDPRRFGFSALLPMLLRRLGDSYVLVATDEAVYDWVFLERMLAAAQDEDADVVACFDYGNRLRVASEDFNRMLKTRGKGTCPTIECPPDKRLTVFSPADIPEYAISILSPSFANNSSEPSI